MKQIIKGITYDTETSRELAMCPGAGVDTTLYVTRGGHYFLHVLTTLLDGKPIPRNKFIEELVPDYFEILKREGRHPRVEDRERIRPLSRAEAFRWCIRTQIPRTFHKDIARFLK